MTKPRIKFTNGFWHVSKCQSINPDVIRLYSAAHMHAAKQNKILLAQRKEVSK